MYLRTIDYEFNFTNKKISSAHFGEKDGDTYS